MDVQTNNMSDVGYDLGANSTPTTGDGDGNSTMGGNGYGMPTYAQAIIIVMYSAITVLAVGGNVIVCYIVLAYQRMRTVTNYFIVNLACSDIMMAVVCIPFTFIANVLMHYWPFGSVMCPLVSYAQGVSVFLSAFTLVSISLDRYIAIIYPLRPRMTTKQAAIIIGATWFLGLAVPLPIAIFSRVERQVDYLGVEWDYCIEEWPDQEWRYIYSLLIMVLQYFLPLFVLMFTYARIAIVIWVKKAPGEAQNNRDQRMAASKRKMVKMMMTVVIIYALCWLPFHTITLVGDTHEAIWRFQYIQIVWSGCHWLAMSNCCYNPMVYCWMNSKFRNGFRYVLRWCPCVTFDEDEHGPYKIKRVNTYITTMKNSIKDKRGPTGTSPSPSRYRENYSVYSNHEHIENIPLHKVQNGGMNANKRPGNRDPTRTGDQGYTNPEQLNTLGERSPLTMDTED